MGMARGAGGVFTQHPSAFVPDYMSSQIPGLGYTLSPSNGSRGGGGAGGSGAFRGGGGTERGSSGFLPMGYDSQFDVEGQESLRLSMEILQVWLFRGQPISSSFLEWLDSFLVDGPSGIS